MLRTVVTEPEQFADECLQPTPPLYRDESLNNLIAISVFGKPQCVKAQNATTRAKNTDDSQLIALADEAGNDGFRSTEWEKVLRNPMNRLHSFKTALARNSSLSGLEGP